MSSVGEYWDVFVRDMGQWRPAKVINELGDKIELQFQDAPHLPDLVSVRKHFESFESFVIQSGDLIREGRHDVDGEEPRTLRPQQIAISE